MRSRSLVQGGSNPRSLETTGKLQILQQVEVHNIGKGNSHIAKIGTPLYSGINPHVADRVAEDGKENENRK